MTGFELVGARGFKVKNADEAKKIVTELISGESYKLIILPERFTIVTADMRTQLLKKGKIWPVFAIVPDLSGIKGKRVEEIKSIIGSAVGAKLKLE